MKFKPEAGGAPPDEALVQEYGRGEVFGKLRLGEKHIFFKKFSGVSYLTGRQVLRAWLRQEEVKARLCCGTANFDQFYVVLECADGRERRGQVADKAEGQACLEGISARFPEVKTGYVRPDSQS